MSVITEAVAEAMAEKLARKIMLQLSGQYGTVLHELSESQNKTSELTAKIAKLETQLNSQQQNINKSLTTLNATTEQYRTNSQKAQKLLDKAISELGLEE